MTDRTPLLTLASELKAAHGRTTGPKWVHNQAGKTDRDGKPYDWIGDAHAGQHSKIICLRNSFYGGADDYTFIATAHRDVPTLCDALAEVVGENERLQAENEMLRQGLESIRDDRLGGPRDDAAMTAHAKLRAFAMLGLRRADLVSTPNPGEDGRG